MKKLFNILIMVSLLMVINVKADMGPPIFPTLEFEVTNPDGAKCYDYELLKVSKTYAYGSVVETTEENPYSDELSNYYSIEFKTDNYYETCFIKRSDLSIKQDDYKVDEEAIEKNNSHYQIWALEDVKIYSGPSTNFYKELATLPKDTKLEPMFYLPEFWYYIEYNGVKGYVSSEKEAIVNNRYAEGEYFTTLDSDMYERPLSIDENEEYKTLTTVPANTSIKNYWETDYYQFIYFEYNGTYGFLNNVGFATNCAGSKIKAINGLTVYDNLGAKRLKLGTIPKDKEYDVTYCYEQYSDRGYYLPAMKGWVYNNYIAHDYEKDDPEDVIAPWEFVVFTNEKGEVDDPRNEANILEKVEIVGHEIEFSKSTKSYTVEITEDEDKLNFVVTPQTEGIDINIKNNDNLTNGSVVTLEIGDDNKRYTFEFNIKVKEPEKQEPSKDVIPPKKDEDKKDGLSDQTLIIICIGAGVLVALTALVTILLVNKRNKKEKEVLVQNTPVVEPSVENNEKVEANEEGKNE